jgi:hypothetical protein
VIFLVAALALLCGIQTLRMLLAWRYLTRAQTVGSQRDAPMMMYLLVPVLYEQSVIDTTFHRFAGMAALRPWLCVVFVTSAREDSVEGRSTTHQLLVDYVARPHAGRVRLFKYPGTEGVMAHQLNYAVDQILREQTSPFLIAVYNVDSVPGWAAIDYAHMRLSEDHSRVLQQYAVYPPKQSRGYSGRVLSHVAAWQTRWSLHFELGRLLVDHRVAPEPSAGTTLWDLLRPMHYAIGHGLFLASTTWEWTTGLAEDEINEDAQLGLLLHVCGRRIEPVPFLEVAEPPPTLSAYIRQQAVWFNGPFYALRYARKLWYGSSGRHFRRPMASGLCDRLNVAFAAGKLALHAVYWLTGPPLLVGATIVMVLRGDWLAVTAWIALSFYYVYGLNVLANALARRISTQYASSAWQLGDPTAALAAYLLHCVGPVVRLSRLAAGSNRLDKKYKTERKEPSRPA